MYNQHVSAACQCITEELSMPSSTAFGLLLTRLHHALGQFTGHVSEPGERIAGPVHTFHQHGVEGLRVSGGDDNR